MSKKITNPQIIKNVAAEVGMSQQQVGLVLDAFYAEVINNLKDGADVSISGFGRFELRKRAAKHFINPKTKQCAMLPAMSIPAFTFGNTVRKLFKEE